MIDLRDTTFTIPVRIDHPKRRECLELVISYLLKHFDTNILIGEESPEFTLADLNKTCRVHHFLSHNKWFYRTQILNNLAKLSQTPIIVNYDADVLLPIAQYVESVEALRSGKASLILPYAGRCLDVPVKFHSRIQKELDISFVRDGQCHCTNPHAVGGAVFWSKKVFFAGGMENENFKSWGYEDNERLSRFKKLGFKSMRVSGHLYHLSHPRSYNSVENNLSKLNEKEFYKIQKMSVEQLKTYMKTWSWLNFEPS